MSTSTYDFYLDTFTDLQNKREFPARLKGKLTDQEIEELSKVKMDDYLETNKRDYEYKTDAHQELVGKLRTLQLETDLKIAKFLLSDKKIIQQVEELQQESKIFLIPKSLKELNYIQSNKKLFRDLREKASYSEHFGQQTNRLYGLCTYCGLSIKDFFDKRATLTNSISWLQIHDKDGFTDPNYKKLYHSQLFYLMKLSAEANLTVSAMITLPPKLMDKIFSNTKGFEHLYCFLTNTNGMKKEYFFDPQYEKGLIEIWCEYNVEQFARALQNGNVNLTKLLKLPENTEAERELKEELFESSLAVASLLANNVVDFNFLINPENLALNTKLMIYYIHLLGVNRELMNSSKKSLSSLIKIPEYHNFFMAFCERSYCLDKCMSTVNFLEKEISDTNLRNRFIFILRQENKVFPIPAYNYKQEVRSKMLDFMLHVKDDDFLKVYIDNLQETIKYFIVEQEAPAKLFYSEQYIFVMKKLFKHFTTIKEYKIDLKEVIEGNELNELLTALDNPGQGHALDVFSKRYKYVSEKEEKKEQFYNATLQLW